MSLENPLGWLLLTSVIFLLVVMFTVTTKNGEKSRRLLNKKSAISETNASSRLQGKSSPNLSIKDFILLNRVKTAEHLFHPIILKAANQYKIDPALIKAIILAESQYNPRAVSKKGAKGLMQLMPLTASEMEVEDVFNPEHNIDAGVRYFKKLLAGFEGDTNLALAAYHAGSEKVRKHGGIPPFKATRHYIKKVLEYYRYYKKELT